MPTLPSYIDIYVTNPYRFVFFVKLSKKWNFMRGTISFNGRGWDPLLRFVQIKHPLSPTTQTETPRPKWMNKFCEKGKQRTLCERNGFIFIKKKKKKSKRHQTSEKTSSQREVIKKKSLYKRDGGGRVIVSSGRCFLCPFLRGHAPLLPLQGTTTTVSTNTLNICCYH